MLVRWHQVLTLGTSVNRRPTFSGDTMANESIVPTVTDDWTVPKLLGIAVVVLGTFFVFIYNISP